jgi:hypothetical protein
MGLRGKRLYQCDACQAQRFIHWVEFNRSAKPRCTECGCSRLDLVSEAGKDEALERQRQRVAGSTGSVVLAKRADLDPHRKVT